MEMKTQLPGPTDAPFPVELRMLYPMLWGRQGLLALPNGKTWVKVDLRWALEKRGINSSLVAIGVSQSPVYGLDQLRGSKHAKKLGNETIERVQTTHYGVTVDLHDALAKAAPKERQALQRLLHLAKGYRVKTALRKIDVWVGDDGYVRRIVQTLGGYGPVTTTFFDLGTPVQIDAPPAGETIDVTQLSN